MGSQIGEIFKVSVFGESHGTAIGCVIEGIPAGTKLDLDLIKKRMAQRKPGQGSHSTPRQEGDRFEILSGFFEDHTTGTPLCMMIKNHDTRSNDYEKTKSLLRPSNADYTGTVKWHGANDFRGGGHFSARLTAPLVFAGAIAEQLLNEQNIKILSQVESVGAVKGDSLSNYRDLESLFDKFDTSSLLIQPEIESSVLEEVEKARLSLDSVGGVVETLVLGMPVGVGNPIFDTIESELSYGLFGIPAVKGVSFGLGFDFTQMRGSEANDAFVMNEGIVRTRTNHNGGINGGISNGMPIWFRCAFKPTPSIARQQDTVNLETLKEEKIEIVGRHDPCVALRGAVVVKAVTAIKIYDLIRKEMSNG